MLDFSDLGILLAFAAGVIFFTWGAYKILRTTRILYSGGVADGEGYGARHKYMHAADEEPELVTSILFFTDENRMVSFEQVVPVVRKSYRVFYDKAKPDRAVVFPWLEVIYGTILTGFGGYFIAETYSKFFATLVQKL